MFLSDMTTPYLRDCARSWRYAAVIHQVFCMLFESNKQMPNRMPLTDTDTALVNRTLLVFRKHDERLVLL
jgi:hypothetical protein